MSQSNSIVVDGSLALAKADDSVNTTGSHGKKLFRIRLRRMLSAHEIAVLLMLASAPVELTAASPDFAALQDAGLISAVGTQFTLTEAGSEVLNLLARR
jgi:hypothetical protein